MLTDEELTARLEAAFHETGLELTYDGRVPRVRRAGGLAATSALAAAVALALAPAALQRDEGTGSQVVPSTRPGTQPPTRPGHRVIRTFDLGGLRFAYAQVAGLRGPLYLIVGSDLGLPPDAQKADIHAAGGADVWFAHEPAEGDPQVYVKPAGSSTLYGVYGQGWTSQELIFLLEHPLAAQRGHH